MRKLKNKFRKYLWTILKLKVTLNSGLVVKVCSDSDWVIYNEIFVFKEYDEIFNYLNLTASNIKVLDLGANVGYFSFTLADFYLKNGVENFSILAVEADKYNYFECKSRLEGQLKNSQFSIIEGLIGKVNGTASLLTEFHHFGHSVIGEGVETKNSNIISYVNLNNFINDDESITLIKCDIEGSEEDFINEYSAILKRTQLFICEFHYRVDKLVQLRETLNSYGFNFSKIIKIDTRYNTTVELFVKQL